MKPNTISTTPTIETTILPSSEMITGKNRLIASRIPPRTNFSILSARQLDVMTGVIDRK